MNYFVEGIQGSGKSTLVKTLAGLLPEHIVFQEGDVSPVELAWCAYVDREKYGRLLEKYAPIRQEIEERSVCEEGHVIIPYTRILTDLPGFHKDLEQYEIYNGRTGLEEFKQIVLSRYKRWDGQDGIFECSLFQNTIEDMILFRCMKDEEILDFYKEVKDSLEGKTYRIIYLETTDFEENLATIRKERSDDAGNEMWFPLMMGYFNVSPYARETGVSGEEALLAHFKHRQEMELRICREIFGDRSTVLVSKKWSVGDFDE